MLVVRRIALLTVGYLIWMPSLRAADGAQDTRHAASLEVITEARAKDGAGRRRWPLSLLGRVDQYSTPYTQQVHVNFESELDLVGRPENKQEFVLNEAYVQSQYFADRRVTVLVGRQLLSEGFDLALLDGAIAHYHVTPKVMTSVYGGRALYDEGLLRNEQKSRVAGGQIGYFNGNDFTAAAFLMDKSFADAVNKIYIGTNANKTFALADGLDSDLFYHVEQDAAAARIVQSNYGTRLGYRDGVSTGINVGQYQGSYNFYHQSEAITDYFAKEDVRQVSYDLAIYFPTGTQTQISYAVIRHGGARNSTAPYGSIKQYVEAYIIDVVEVSTGLVAGSLEFVRYHEVKLRKHLQSWKLDFDGSYAVDRYRKVNTIQGSAQSAELGAKYLLSQRFDSRLSLAWVENNAVSKDVYGVFYLSYHSF